MVLQTPVEGGHEGGRFKVEHLDQTKVFNVSEDSATSCHLTAFYSDCPHQLEEVAFGWRLALVFNLELEPHQMPIFSPHPNLQTFLDVNNLRNILTKWNQLEEGPEFFALLLEHRYSAPGLNFDGLKGNDRHLHQLFQSIDNVDVRLSQIQKYEKGTVVYDDEESDFEDDCLCCLAKDCKCVSRADQSVMDEILEEDVKILNFCAEIDVDCDVIQFDRQLFAKPEKKRMSYEDQEPFLSCWYDHPVLVIWPKSKSLDMALSCDFTAQLTRLESNPEAEIFSKVIDFCVQHPDRVWTEDREDRTRRLIQICLNLDCKTGGLRFLNAIASEFVSKKRKDYEGIRNAEIAIGIAKLVALIGWENCLEVVEKLTKINRAEEQIENYAHLTVGILDLGLIEYGKYLGNKICYQLHALMPSLSPSAMVASFAMILRMYEIEGSATIRLTSFADSLKSLDFAHLFPVVADETFSQLSRKNPFFRNVQRNLQKHLTTCKIPDDMAADVMSFFLQLDDAILLKEFTNRIVKQEESLAVSKILESPDVWNISLLSSVGRWSLRLLVDDRIRCLERIREPIFNWFQHCTTSMDDLDAQLLNFFRSRSFRETFSGFANRRAATDWITKFIGRDQVRRGYSARAVIEEERDGEISCVVTKTRHYFEDRMEKFLVSRVELLALRDRRLRRLGKGDDSAEAVESCSKRIRFN